MSKFQFILASASPRRAELLGHLGINIRRITEHVEENSVESEFHKYVMDISEQKGRAVFEKHFKDCDNFFIVSSDTVVAIEDTVLEKPSNIEHARKMLEKLSGKTHSVYTAVSIHYYSKLNEEMVVKNFYDKTDVTFDEIPEDILNNYLMTKDSLDKAGAYGIQGAALSFIKNLNGSYSSVMGFPLNQFVHEMKTILKKESLSENYKDCFN